MKNIIILMILFQYTVQEKMTIFNFKEQSSANGWYVVNDGVMGGLSEGKFRVSDNTAFFEGMVSTANNGGFTMIQNRFKKINSESYSAFVLNIKGDGKTYQFRTKSDKNSRHSYVYQFPTNGEWQEITIPFSSLAPRFRGRSLDLPNFDGNQIEEIAFLIGNKRNESFELQIRKILVE